MKRDNTTIEWFDEDEVSEKVKDDYVTGFKECRNNYNNFRVLKAEVSEDESEEGIFHEIKINNDDQIPYLTTEVVKNDETNICKANKPHAPVKLERIFSCSKVKTTKKEKLLDFNENFDNKPNEIKRVQTYDINDKYKEKKCGKRKSKVKDYYVTPNIPLASKVRSRKIEALEIMRISSNLRLRSRPHKLDSCK